MIADRQQLGLYFFIDHILEKDLKKAEDVTISFFSYLKRDFNNIYSLIDKDVSIKCVFNQEGIADYLAGSPDAVPFDDLDGYLINLTKFRLDYLVYENADKISYKIVCVVDKFEIDKSKRTDIIEIPPNVNLFSEIRRKMETYVTNALKTVVGNTSLTNQVLSAKNFITGNFISDQRPASIFTLLKKTKGFEDDNILLKSNISLKDASYFAIDDMDIKILEKLKQINWRFLLSRYPSMVEKEEDEIFVYNKTDTKSLKRKLTDAYLIPSKIKADTEITKLKIEKFLLHKVKRQRAVKSTERIPDKISYLMDTYGDMCANMNHDLVEKYRLFKRYSEKSCDDN